MTAEGLIAELQKLPGNTPICVIDNADAFVEVGSIDQFKATKKAKGRRWQSHKAKTLCTVLQPEKRK